MPVANLEQQIVPISDVKELKKHLRPIYIIDDYMRCDEDYKKFQDQIYDIIKGCYEHKELREYPIKFKFYKTDTKTHTLQLRHFLVNVFSWYPFIHLYGIQNVLDESFIVDCINGIPNFTDYVNEKIIKVLQNYSIKNVTVNWSISEVLYNMRRISIDFALLMNLSISSETFLKVYKEIPRMREIMTTKFDMSLQPAEIEHELTGLMNEEIKIFKSLPDNPVGIILRAGSGIKNKQLSEFSVNMGLKPDLSGVTIPIPINSNTLIGGLDKTSAHYLDALGARKSLIMNKKVIRNVRISLCLGIIILTNLKNPVTRV